MLAQSAEKSTVIAKTSSLVLAVDGAEFTKLISLLPALKTVLSLRLVEMVSVEELLLLEPAAAELLRFMEGEFVTESYYFLDEQGTPISHACAIVTPSCGLRVGKAISHNAAPNPCRPSLASTCPMRALA